MRARIYRSGFRRTVVGAEMATCLICVKDNPEGTLLCTKCGAPLPDEAPAESSAAPSVPGPGPTRRSKTPWLIAGAAVVTITVVVLFVWFWNRSNSSAEGVARDLPAGLAGVGAWDIEGLFAKPWVAKALDAPMVSGVLRSAKDASGVDILALESAAGGFRMDGNTIHMIGVVKGRFDGDRIRSALADLGMSDEQVIGEHRFVVVEIPAALMFPQPDDDPFQDLIDTDTDTDFEDEADAAEEPGPATIGKLPPPAVAALMPVVPPMLLGTIDERTFVYGSAVLIEEYLKGDKTIADDADMMALVERVSDDAVAWGVGRFTAEQSRGWWSVIPLKDQVRMAKYLLGATFLAEMRLHDSIVVQLSADMPTEEAAQKVKALWHETVPLFGAANFGLAAMGASPPVVEASGKTVGLRFEIPLPPLP
ncbi:MAG: hypothetical protein ACI9OJ_005080 [Myxococcota bacterium]